MMEVILRNSMCDDGHGCRSGCLCRDRAFFDESVDLTTGVSRLVYTSTNNVTFVGEVIDGDETWPYTEARRDLYTSTKRAEQTEGPQIFASRHL